MDYFFYEKIMITILGVNKSNEVERIEFEENHFIFQIPFFQELDFEQPISIPYEILNYFKNPNINHGLSLNEVIHAIEMLCFDLETKKLLLSPFIHTEEYKNAELLKYFDEFDIYLFPNNQLKYFLDYLILKPDHKIILN